MAYSEKWLKDHLEGFVFDNLKYIPIMQDPNLVDTNKINFSNICLINQLKNWNKRTVRALEVCWAEAKKQAKGRTILLAGRDVYPFEMLNQLEGCVYPTVFRPDISSSSHDYVKEDYTEYFLIDSGNRGSIPKSLKMEHWKLIYYSSPEAKCDPPKRGEDYLSKSYLARCNKARLPGKIQRQLFPYSTTYSGNKGGAVSNLYNLLEGDFKYWNHGEPGSTHIKGDIRQEVSVGYDMYGSNILSSALPNRVCNFTGAALTTRWVCFQLGVNPILDPKFEQKVVKL